jgi:hypothetical protein
MRKEIARIFATIAVVSLFASALWADGKNTRFEVSSTIPTNGARGVPINQVLTATFNQDVNCSTVTTSTFTLNRDKGNRDDERWDSEGWDHSRQHGAVAGTVGCSGTVATFTPDADLAAHTDYTATITDRLRDVRGQTLECAFVWRFRTGSKPRPPTVTAVTPRNKATGVPLNTKITATFDQAMNPATIDASTFTLSGPGGSVGGIVTYDALNNTATLIPNANLLANKKYTATITTGVTNLCGTALEANFVWTFTTGASTAVTPPTVILTNPANLATDVPLNQIITATFSEAMDSATITTTAFTLTSASGPVSGAVTYAAVGDMATFTPSADLTANTLYTATITTGVTDQAGNPMASNYVWTFTTGAAVVTTPPTVVLTNPVSNATGVCLNAAINATFSTAMDPATINTGTFTVTVAGVPVTGTISLNATGTIATFTPLNPLTLGTTYTVTITTGATDLAGIPLASDELWIFTTATTACVVTSGNLGAAAPFGAFGGGAGITNQGILTVINGDIGTTGASTLVTGFHDHLVAYLPPAGCIYTETPLNIGNVTGEIYTAPPPPTITCPDEGTGPAATPGTTFYVATQAAADALTAYNALAALPHGPDPSTAGNLGGLTLPPGTYTAAAAAFSITGSDLTLDAQGNASAVWVFQMATSLTVGAPAAPRSVILTGGAQAANVFWQVGSAATINGAGGGTMVGTIIAPAGITFSTAGNLTITTLNGRALGLNASVTMVNTVINVP